MRLLVAWLVAFGLVVPPAMAGTGGAGSKKEAAAAESKPASATASAAGTPATAGASAKPEEYEMEGELRQLRDLLATQTEQLQEQSKQLQEEQTQMRLLKEQLMSASESSSTNAVTAPASSAVAGSADPAAIGPAPPTGARSTGAAAGQAGQESPPQNASITFKGITLTPGGYMAAETVWRSKALSADVNTPFNSVPFPGSSQNRVSEFNASGRQSRISMLAEGKLNSVKIGGYYEGDFLSAGTTSNGNESNSYTFRQRQFWGQAAFHSGWTFTGGQMWSLVTETKHGVDNRTEATPLTIDAQYNVGFSWARQYGFRIAKNFNDKVWLAMSVENSQTTFSAHGTPANPNFLLGAAGAGGGLLNPLANYSFNAAPDFIFKAVFEPGWGHYEIFGIVSTFRDRVFPCANASATAPCGGLATPSAIGAFNDKRVGGGIGANARATIFHHVDVGVHFLEGNGIGRYGTAGLADATVRPDGTLALVKSYQALGTLEWHSAKWDIYSNVGGEYAARTWYLNSAGKPVGYGSPLFANSGCWTETAPGTSTPAGTTAGAGYIPGGLSNCTGDTRNIIEGTLGFWYRFYKGPKGTVQWGPQYSYVVRNTWRGVGTASGAGVSGEPHGVENMVFTSFRYYLP